MQLKIKIKNKILRFWDLMHCLDLVCYDTTAAYNLSGGFLMPRNSSVI